MSVDFEAVEAEAVRQFNEGSTTAWRMMRELRAELVALRVENDTQADRIALLENERDEMYEQGRRDDASYAALRVENDTLRTALQDAESALDALLAVGHHERGEFDDSPYCIECMEDWPCPVARYGPVLVTVRAALGVCVPDPNPETQT